MRLYMQYIVHALSPDAKHDRLDGGCYCFIISVVRAEGDRRRPGSSAHLDIRWSADIFPKCFSFLSILHFPRPQFPVPSPRPLLVPSQITFTLKVCSLMIPSRLNKPRHAI